MTSAKLPLEDAARRLRRRTGRPRKVLGQPPVGLGVQSATLKSPKDEGKIGDFAVALQPRGLPLRVAAVYSGLSERLLWRLVSAGRLSPIRVPGCRRVLLLRDDLDRLLEAFVVRPEAAQEPR